MMAETPAERCKRIRIALGAGGAPAGGAQPLPPRSAAPVTSSPVTEEPPAAQAQARAAALAARWAAMSGCQQAERELAERVARALLRC